MKIKIEPRQSLADIAIQEYGDIRAIVDLALANKMSVTTDIEAGTELECPDVTYDSYFQAYVRNNRIKPATMLSEFDDLHPRIFTDQFTKEYI